MNIHLFGAGFKNKGAQLMLATVCDYLREHIPGVRLAISPMEATLEQASRYGIELLTDSRLHTGASPKMFVLSWNFGYLYKFLRRLKGHKPTRGTMTWSEVDAILDLSGLAYSEKWGGASTKNLKMLSKKCMRSGKVFVLMPQAFGPFSSNEIKADMQEAIRNIPLIFARDASSFAIMQSLGEGSKSMIYQCPDLTHLMQVKDNFALEDLEGVAITGDFFTIVPNVRMLDKAGAIWQENYLTLLQRMAESVLRETDLSLMLMVHSTNSGNDRELSETIALSLEEEFSGRVSVWTHEDPVYLKRTLKASSFVIASRFHALVSSLSSGTPCIGTSWQHKYRHLFEEYTLADYLVSEPTSYPEVQLKLLQDKEKSLVIRKNLKTQSEVLRNLVEELLETHLLPLLEAKKDQ